MGRLIAYGSPLGELSAELTERGKRNSALSDGNATTSPKGRGEVPPSPTATPPPLPKGEAFLVKLILQPEIVGNHCDKL